MRRICAAAGALCTALLFLLTGCLGERDNFDRTETVSVEQLRAMIAEAAAALQTAPPAPADTDGPTELAETSAPDALGTVYWSDGGAVWHTDRDCASLRQAAAVHSGSQDEALAAGKARLCQRCAD